MEHETGGMDAAVEEIVASISADTGVGSDEVRRVLERLGVRTAVENRLRLDPKNFRLAVGPLKL